MHCLTPAQLTFSADIRRSTATLALYVPRVPYILPLEPPFIFDGYGPF